MTPKMTRNVPSERYWSWQREGSKPREKGSDGVACREGGGPRLVKRSRSKPACSSHIHTGFWRLAPGSRATSTGSDQRGSPFRSRLVYIVTVSEPSLPLNQAARSSQAPDVPPPSPPPTSTSAEAWCSELVRGSRASQDPSPSSPPPSLTTPSRGGLIGLWYSRHTDVVALFFLLPRRLRLCIRRWTGTRRGTGSWSEAADAAGAANRARKSRAATPSKIIFGDRRAFFRSWMQPSRSGFSKREGIASSCMACLALLLCTHCWFLNYCRLL